MKILVTGYKGFIGSHFTKRFPEAIGYDPEDGKKELIKKIGECEAVIHLGAKSSTTEKDIEKVLSNNLDFSMSLLDHCIRKNIPFQYASSASVYGKIQDGHAASEDDPVDPLSPYAWSKYLLEREIRKYCAGLKKYHKVQGFRYFNVYGEGERHKTNMMSPISRFLNQAINEEEIKVFYNSENFYRDFVYAGDIVNIQTEFLNKVGENGVWNIGTGKTTSFQNIAETISIFTGASIEKIPMPDGLEKQYQNWTLSNNDKLFKSIGNYLFRTPQEYIREACNKLLF